MFRRWLKRARPRCPECSTPVNTVGRCFDCRARSMVEAEAGAQT